MSSLFKTPQSPYTDFYDLARFKMVYRINVILTISLLIISIYFSLNNKTFFFQYFVGFAIALTGLIVLIKTKNFTAVSYFIAFSSLVLVLSSILFVRNIPHLIEPLWLIIIILFAYFNLGRNVGHVILSIVILVMTCYFLFLLNDNFTVKTNFQPSQLIGIVLEFTLCMFIIGFFVHNFIRTTTYAESKFRKANDELIAQNKMIALQNEEKTVLLQEIHHRVKNNLQVITSLLRLQSSEIEAEDAKIHFTDAINRVMTMSLIHQKMYQEKNLSQIDAKDYFRTLIDDLIHSSSVQLPIEINVTAQLEKVGTKTIVPLALLISELVSNSLKHAFQTSGSISVFLSREHDGYFTLEYFDNGTWKDEIRESAFGLQLIQTLSEQLEGEYSRHSNSEGTHYLFRLANLDV